jgi:hypothetical protein
MNAADAAGGIRVHRYRDPDPAVASIEGMDLGVTHLHERPDLAVARWFADGVRRVVLPDLVDLTPGDENGAVTHPGLRCLALLRELGSHGLVVDWQLRLPCADESSWRRFGHLPPPARIRSAAGGDTDPAAAWHREYRLGRFHYRRGPGFVLVRDGRSGDFRSVVLDDPGALAAVAALEHRVETDGLDPTAVARFEAEGWVLRLGAGVCWLPGRLRRWPIWLNHFHR